MTVSHAPRAAILDFGLGNLFSVAQACRTAGIEGIITDEIDVLLAADALIVPGVGAFGDAIDAIRRKGLAEPIVEFADSGRPLLGICLGMQLLMTESHEFGRHRGLGIIPGQVVRFADPHNNGRALKVPHVGWCGIHYAVAWHGDSLLAGVHHGARMYFVHSFYCIPEDDAVTEATAEYGGISFCAGLRHGNVTGYQFHPERSGPVGLKVYRNLRSQLLVARGESHACATASNSDEKGETQC